MRRGGSNPVSMLVALAALAMLAGCGGTDEVVVTNTGIPAEVAFQSESNLAELPEDPADLPRVAWRTADTDRAVGLELHEEDDALTLLLRCGGTPARLQAVVPSFRPSSAGEVMRLAIGTTEIALAAPLTSGAPGTVPLPALPGSTGEAVVPENLPALFAAARGIDVVQGVQRIGASPAPPAAMGRAFAEACLARAR